jgi:hypothetical protein
MIELIDILRKEESYHPNNFKVELPTAHPESSEYNSKYYEIIKNCIEGYWHSGRFMPPQLYFYYNIGMIQTMVGKRGKVKLLSNPLLRDVDWILFYAIYAARGFSGFSNDENYSCNRDLVDKDLELSDLPPSVFRSDGTLKEYIDPIKYLCKNHGENLGLPLYENLAKNICILTARRTGKSAASIGFAYHEWVFNGLKSMSQLHEKYSTRVIIVANIKKHSKEFVSKIKDWHDNLPGVYKTAEDNYPSPFRRSITGSWFDQIVQEKEIFTLSKDGEKVKERIGSKSSILVLTTDSNPYVTAGYSNNLTIAEECGLFTNLLDFYGAHKDTQKEGLVKFGTTIFIGTSGDIEKVASIRKIFESPDEYECLGFPDTFENSGKNIGLFIPATLADINFKDDRLLTNLELANSKIQKVRDDLVYHKASSKTIDEEVMNRPLLPSEMFLNKKGNIFPVYELQKVLNKLNNSHLDSIGNHGHLVRTNTGKGVKFIKDMTGEYEYIHNFNIPSDLRDDYNYLKGAVRIFEEPVDGVEYIIGYDPVHQDYVLKPDSLACMYVYKPFIRGSSFSDCIVAEYTGRYVLTDKINEIAELLSLYYNKALIMMETNIRSNVEYFNRRGLLNLLSYKPIHTLESNMDKITQGNVFGYIKTTALVPILERFTCEWLEKEIGRIYTDVVNDSEGGTILRNMDFIYSKPLLEELISYNRLDDNFDRVDALFAMVLNMKEKNFDIHEYEPKKSNRFLSSFEKLFRKHKSGIV